MLTDFDENKHECSLGLWGVSEKGIFFNFYVCVFTGQAFPEY